MPGYVHSIQAAGSRTGGGRMKGRAGPPEPLGGLHLPLPQTPRRAEGQRADGVEVGSGVYLT